MNEKRILKNVGVVFAILILAKIAAFANDAILAAFIGTSADADAFYMVLGIQQVIYPMLSVGIWKVFLPEYKKNMVLNGEKAADIFANKIMVLFTGFSLIVAGLIFIFHEKIVSVCAPGLKGDVKVLCGELLKISSPLYVFIIISAVIATMLQCHGQFVGSQIREIVSHIPTIITAIFLYQRFGIPALVYGLIAGSLLRFLVEIPFINWEYKFTFEKISFNETEIGMLKKLPEALLTAGIEQINVLADKVMASMMIVGSISALNYAQKLVNVFSGLFGNAIGTALYPQIAEYAAKKDSDKIEKILVQSIYVICFMMVPITIGSIFFSTTIIECVFQRGEFGKEATRLTAITYQFYVIGLSFVGMKAILSNVLYSFGDTKGAVRVSVYTVLVNIILNILLSPYMGTRGLALATSIASIVNVCVSVYILRKYVLISLKKIYKEILKIVLCAFCSCLITYLWLNNIMLSCYVKMLIAVVVCMFLYFGILYVAKSESIRISFIYIRKMLEK